MRGRVSIIDIDYWKNEELVDIPNRGLRLLGIGIDEDILNNFVINSAGSPQLMQNIMLTVCREINVLEKQDKFYCYSASEIDFKSVMMKTATSADYFSIVDKLIDGPKTRGTDRMNFILRNNSRGDVYKILMLALSKEPPLLSLKYDLIKNRIESFCKNDHPSGSSIIRACQQISDISSELAGSPIIEWDSDNDSLHIRDPYLLFFIRWSEKMTNLQEIGC